MSNPQEKDCMGSRLGRICLIGLTLLLLIFSALAISPHLGYSLLSYNRILDSVEDSVGSPRLAEARKAEAKRNVLTPLRSTQQDSLATPLLSQKANADSVLRPSIGADSTALPHSTGADSTAKEEPIVLDDVINFNAQDSMVLKGQNEVFLFGKGKVSYQNMSLASSYMKMRVDSSEVYARYVLDSLGRPTDLPFFTDGDQQLEMETMRYNYDTEKGFITGVLTKQEGGYLIGEKGKRMPDNTLFIESGNFTTCDHVQNPHFCLHMTKAKITPKKNIVTGPVYLVMGGVPLFPIGLPFGYFLSLIHI